MAGATEGRTKAIIDASVLINFLRVDRCDLLGSHPRYAFLVPQDVVDEVTASYQEQRIRLEAAFVAGHLERTVVTSVSELETATRLKGTRLGVGESAAIAAAICRGVPVALQDLPATKKALALAPGLEIVTTQQIIADHVAVGELTAAEVEGLKAQWAKERFRF